MQTCSEKQYKRTLTKGLYQTNTVGFGYRTTGIATTPIVQAPTLVVCKLPKNFGKKGLCVNFLYQKTLFFDLHLVTDNFTLRFCMDLRNYRKGTKNCCTQGVIPYFLAYLTL